MTRVHNALIRTLTILLAAAETAGVATPLAAQLQPDPSMFAALAAADMRLEAVGYRLSTANVARCRDVTPAIGARIHTIDQYGRDYRAAAKAYFGFQRPIAIEGIISGSPADLGGLKVGDGLTHIGAESLPTENALEQAEPTTKTLATAYTALSRNSAGAPLAIGIIRSGAASTVDVTPRPSCASRFELALGERYLGDADGSVVRIGYGFVERLNDDELAVIVAHELSHNILHHAADMDVANIRHGIAGEFGRSAAIKRKLEDAADRASLCLLVSAGYDPTLPAKFWRGSGRRIEGFGPRTGSHRNWKERAALFDQWAAQTLPCDGLFGLS